MFKRHAAMASKILDEKSSPLAMRHTHNAKQRAYTITAPCDRGCESHDRRGQKNAPDGFYYSHSACEHGNPHIYNKVPLPTAIAAATAARKKMRTNTKPKAS